MCWEMGRDQNLSTIEVLSTWKETSGMERKLPLPLKSIHVGMLPLLAGQVLSHVCSSVLHPVCSAASLILNADTVVPTLTYCVKD